MDWNEDTLNLMVALADDGKLQITYSTDGTGGLLVQVWFDQSGSTLVHRREYYYQQPRAAAPWHWMADVAAFLYYQRYVRMVKEIEDEPPF